MTKNKTALTEDLKKYLRPAFERKAQSITAIDVSRISSYTDVIIIVKGRSRRQVRFLAEYIIKDLRDKRIETIGVEGLERGEWALIDFGDVIIHVFEPETENFYDLEGFWIDAPRIDLSEFESSLA